ncbi:hypothetical protein EV652_10676 [Kribbella steppae]|uniref:Uncharacterized protein n=1 Tax=Kribbella steppae TaxID=2512223 RepID=A0A4R2HFT9_9ACTN|nr:hypothetical protein EV652_10676 [Kribbella steppae]
MDSLLFDPLVSVVAPDVVSMRFRGYATVPQFNVELGSWGWAQGGYSLKAARRSS